MGAKQKAARMMVVLLLLSLMTTIALAEEEEELVRVTGVDLDHQAVTLEVGQKVELTAVVYPLNATDRRVRWINSDPEVVEVVGSGHMVELVSRSQGQSTITVITLDGGQEKNCLVEVIVPVRSIGIDQKDITLAPGESVALSAQVEPREANEQGIIWESSHPKVAVVDEIGMVKALGIGEARIIARSEENRGISTYCTVVVPDETAVLEEEGVEAVAEPLDDELYGLAADAPLTGILFVLGAGIVLGGGTYLALRRRRNRRVVSPVLVGLSGIYAGQRMAFVNNQITVGRDPETAQVVYPGHISDISRRHCTVYYDKKTGQLTLEDNSFNGTFLADGNIIGQNQKHNLQPEETFSLTESGEVFTVELE